MLSGGLALHFAGYEPVRVQMAVVVIGRVGNACKPAIQDATARDYWTLLSPDLKATI